MMKTSLDEIESRVLDLSSRQFDIDRAKLSLDTRPVQDLGIDSLDLVEWMMAVEEVFDVALPDPVDGGDPVYKEVFTRPDLTLRDMAELVYLRQGTGRYGQIVLEKAHVTTSTTVPFTQLGGVLQSAPRDLYRSLGRSECGLEQVRRMTDGMVCLVLPGGQVEIGSRSDEALPDERPLHSVRLPPFLIDRETVSTTAYCRFLNSIGETDEDVLQKWFLMALDQRRYDHQLIEKGHAGWSPKPGTEEWPMVLVSWHGAVAYSLWAHNEDWRRDCSAYLPTEAQWEYAARGPTSVLWPWGDSDPQRSAVNAGRHTKQTVYDAVTDLPLAPVNAVMGVSPFGGLHMAGNVWQWCADWFDPLAYARDSDTAPGPILGTRSERGGSWVGPIDLARSSYRRGRVPNARGRCLGFRCARRAETV